jgi:hypothetical protein
MSHHLSGLGISETTMDPCAHITDLFVFQKPGEAEDARFRAKWAAVFEQAGGRPTEEAHELAGRLVPDILSYDFSVASGYLNGRTLRDDVVNMGIGMLTGGKVPHDGLRPHDDLLGEFPYLGPPHAAVLSGRRVDTAEGVIG